MTKQKTFGRSRPSIAYELEYRRELQKLLKEMQKDVQEQLEAYFSDTANDGALSLWVDIFKRLREKWYKRFEVRGREIAKWLADKTKKRTDAQILRKLKENGFTLTPHYTGEENALINEIIANNVAMIKSIPQSYLGEVQEAVSYSFKRGYDSERLYKRLKDIIGRVNENSDNRAQLIARDQMQKATQDFAIASAKEYGATKGRWIHVPGRYSSRITHVHMDGEVFDLNVGLYDSDVRRNVKPGELPYCMCQFEVLMPGFDD